MQANKFVPATRLPVLEHHVGDIVPATSLVHTSFRIKQGACPAFVRKNNAVSKPSGAYTGTEYQFTYPKIDDETGKPYTHRGQLNSVSVDQDSFAEHTLIDAYCEDVWNKNKRRYMSVVVFWWQKGGAVNPKITTNHSQLLSYFKTLCGNVWDYGEMYLNPPGENPKCEENLALVFKGASKGKPVQHVIGIDDEPLSEVDVSLVDSAQAVDVPQVDAVDPMKYLTTLATLGSMVEEDTAARTLPGTGKSELSTALAEKLGALLGKK